MKYENQTLFSKLEYTLKDEELEFKQTQKFGQDLFYTVKLRSLTLPHGESYKKSECYFLPTASIGLMIFLLSLFFLGPDPITESKTFITLLSFAVAVLIGSFFTGKKEKMVFYCNESNDYIFSIIEKKNDRENFDFFIEEVNKKIKEVNRKSDSTGI